LALLGSLIVIGAGMFGFNHIVKSHVPAISVQEATRIVFAQFPNCRILVMQLDRKESQLVYEVDLVTAEEHKKEIRINAETGQVEKVLTVTSVSPPVV
jgi:uncharacterized membrane protein YkoI